MFSEGGFAVLLVFIVLVVLFAPSVAVGVVMVLLAALIMAVGG